MMKNNGPKMDPCGTPNLSCPGLDLLDHHSIICNLCERYDCINLTGFTLIQQYFNFDGFSYT